MNYLPPLSDSRFLQLVRETINAMLNGRGNQSGTFTLTANAASTVVTDNLFGASQTVSWTATTANASAALGGMYVSARTNGSFTVTHANNAQTDRTFIYSRHG